MHRKQVRSGLQMRMNPTSYIALSRHRRLGAGVVLVAALGACAFGPILYHRLCADLVQYFLRESWYEALAGVQRSKPWPGAGIWPVARLEVPRLGVDLVVFTSAQRLPMAFGPYLLPGSSMPGGAGQGVVSGTQEAHFRFIHRLKVGDELVLETADRMWHRYRVVAVQTSSKPQPLIPVAAPTPQIKLVARPRFGAGKPGRAEKLVIAEYVPPQPAIHNRWRKMLASI